MRILLTGPTGQIGSELLRALPALGEVIAVDRAQMDLTDPEGIRKMMRSIEPDLVVNAAGYTDVDRAEREEELAHRINATAPGILAQEARRLGAAIVHYSTDYVFNGRTTSLYVNARIEKTRLTARKIVIIPRKILLNANPFSFSRG